MNYIIGNRAWSHGALKQMGFVRKSYTRDIWSKSGVEVLCVSNLGQLRGCEGGAALMVAWDTEGDVALLRSQRMTHYRYPTEFFATIAP